MITFLEYSKRIDDVVNELQSGAHGSVMVQVASDALAMISKRIYEKGENAEGNQFPAYSRKPMLANRKGMTVKAYSQIAGSKKKRRELKWVTIGGKKLFQLDEGYKQFRELHGRQTGFVDFAFFGRMWGNIKITSSPEQHNKGVAVIAPTQELEKKKLEGNTKRKGEILALSEDEKQRLTVIYEEGILNIFRRNNL